MEKELYDTLGTCQEGRSGSGKVVRVKVDDLKRVNERVRCGVPSKGDALKIFEGHIFSNYAGKGLMGSDGSQISGRSWEISMDVKGLCKKEWRTITDNE